MVPAFHYEEVAKKAANIAQFSCIIKPVNAIQLFAGILTMFDKELDGRLLATILAKQTDLYSIRGARVLLVDDLNDNRIIIQSLLEPYELDVEIARNGLEAVEKVTESTIPFDVVLMDVQMPVMDGNEATVKIREHVDIDHLPIIAMTASAMIHDINKCMDSGMNDHVSKPIEVEQLFSTLLKWVPEKEGAGDGAQPGSRTNPVSSQGQEHDNLPDALPGFDLAAGIRRCDGNKKLLFKLINNFHETYGDMDERIARILAAGDYKTAEKLLHEVKGISGNISATRLYKTTAAMEKSVKNSNLEQLPGLLKQLTDDLELFRSALASIDTANGAGDDSE